MSINRLAGLALVGALATLVGISGESAASGTYSGRPPHPPTSIDRASYELGKHVFSGKVEASANAGAEQQAELKALRERLPSKARSKERFSEQAGQLSEEQVAALRYFLQKRYKVQ
jgi:hypothetical protein